MPLRSLALTAAIVTATAALAFAQATAPSTKADELSAAARKGDAATVKRLLDEGVDVNTKFRYDTTALFYACDHGHIEVVKVLLDKGADVNAKDTFYGFTPLMLAISPAQTRRPEHTEIAKLLIAKGARGKEQALIPAVDDGDVAMVKVILDSGGLPPATLSDALESAKAKGKTDIVPMLVAAGAKVDESVKVPPEQLAAYAGTYRSTGSGPELVFAIKGTRLVGGPPGQQSFILIPVDTTSFRIIGAPALSVAFQAAEGKVTGLTLKQGQNTTPYTRVEGK